MEYFSHSASKVDDGRRHRRSSICKYTLKHARISKNVLLGSAESSTPALRYTLAPHLVCRGASAKSTRGWRKKSLSFNDAERSTGKLFKWAEKKKAECGAGAYDVSHAEKREYLKRITGQEARRRLRCVLCTFIFSSRPPPPQLERAEWFRPASSCQFHPNIKRNAKVKWRSAA